MSQPQPDSPGPDSVGAAPGASLAADDLIQQFVEHWGMMARAWGINATMGELFALLYITGTDWTAEDLRQRLRVSRGNVSMNLRELIGWGVVHKVHRQGERKEFYRAEIDVWTLFRRILVERKRRELDPTLGVLARTASMIEADPQLHPLQSRVVALQRFFGLIDALAAQLTTLEPADVDQLRSLLEMTGGIGSTPPGADPDTQHR